MSLILKNYRANRIYKFVHRMCINPLQILKTLRQGEFFISVLTTYDINSDLNYQLCGNVATG